jgi:hypothetical protein
MPNLWPDPRTGDRTGNSWPGTRTGNPAAGDYLREMPVLDQIDEPTAEAILAGRPVPPALEPLTLVVAAYRRAADRPVPPSPALAEWMAAGGGRRRRKKMAAVEVLAGVAAKLTGMSLAAKALAGVAIASAGVASAGFAGALPEPAQERFESVVETVTPVEFPAGEHTPFGEEVSEDAKDGGVDGAEISEKARQLGDQHAPAELPAPVDPADPGQPAELPTPDEPGPPNPPPGEDHRPTPPPGR